MTMITDALSHSLRETERRLLTNLFDVKSLRRRGFFSKLRDGTCASA